MATIEQSEKSSNEKLFDLINEKLESLSIIKFAAYRVACKLRILQKYLKLTHIDYNILVRAFNSHQLEFSVETKFISYENARTILTAIYQLISSYHFNEFTIEETVQTLIKYLYEILQIKENENLDVNSFKIILFTLSNAKLPEKYRSFFRQITSPNVNASQVKLTELFEILLKLPNHFDNVDSFQMDNIPACVQSCLDHTHDGTIREDIFVNWMSREPQTLVWLPTLHRLIATETIRHEAQCNTCKAYPIIGMRYRCLRCFNYDLCQTCFFTGDHTKNHDGTHPIEEYCKQVTPFEDLKAFFEFIKIKMGKNEPKRKERYLSIERSKSFSDVPVHKTNQTMTNEHHSLTRQGKTTKNTQLEDFYRPMTKTETNGISSIDVQEIPIINDEQSKISPTKQKQLIDDHPPILMPKQNKFLKQTILIKQQQEEELIQSEHYQLPPKDKNHIDEDDDDYRPPLPPKLRHQNNTSRALVYDFIGNELQELRATLAQFDRNSTTA